MNMDKEKFSLGDMVILLGWWGAMRAKIAVESTFQGVTRPEVCGCEESKELRSALEKATKALEALRTEAISGKPEAFVDRKGCNFHQQNGQVFDTFCHSCWRAQWASAPKESIPKTDTKDTALERLDPGEPCVRVGDKKEIMAKEKTPVERLLDNVVWKPVSAPGPGTNSLPFVTHEGVLDIPAVGMKLRVFQLSDGRRIFDHDEFMAWLSSGGLDKASDLDK